MHYPRIIIFRKILFGLLALHSLAGAVMLYGAVFLHDGTAFAITIGLTVSIFYLVLLITLINYVEYLDGRLGALLDRFIHLENDLNLDKVISPSTNTLPKSRGNLSERLGKL